MIILRIFATFGLVLLIALLGLAVYLAQQPAPIGTPVVAQVAALPRVSPTMTATMLPPSATPLPLSNALGWFPGSVVEPSPTPTVTPSITPTNTPGPRSSAGPPIDSQSFSASFSPGGGAFMHNVRTALDANNGALRYVVVAPGETFSFNSQLGPRPYLLPWKNVYVNLGSVQPPADRLRIIPVRYNPVEAAPLEMNADVANLQVTPPAQPWVVGTRQPVATPQSPQPPQPQPTLKVGPPLRLDPGNPAQPAPPRPTVYILPEIPAAPVPVEEPTEEPTAEPPPTPVPMVPVLGGGVCDLASRYVVAARPLLPDAAFTFKLHPNGLGGVRYQDAVSIWFDGTPAELDLHITNTTEHWLVFRGDIQEGEVTITATLQGPPEEMDINTLETTETIQAAEMTTTATVEISPTAVNGPTATATVIKIQSSQ